MKTHIHFVIPEILGGKGRPRFSTRGGKIRTYTPAKTRADEEIVRHYARQAMAGLALLEGPLFFEMNVMRQYPKLWPAKRRDSTTWITGKPDADNAAKMAIDALNAIVFRDDSQIAVLKFQRTYGPKNFVDIRIEELE